MNTLLICNAQIVNEGSIQRADVFIRDGRIARIGADLSHLLSDQFIDASGLYLIPGMIDSQFSVVSESLTPEVLSKECIAAVAGGITSVFMLPDLTRDNVDRCLAECDLNGVANKLVNNFAYYQAPKIDNLERLQEIQFKHCCGVFVSMVDTQDEYRFDDPEVFQSVLEASPALVAVHAECAPLIIENEESYRLIYGDEIPLNLHSAIRNQEVCSSAAEEVLEMAEKTKARLHLLHVSSASEVELLNKFRPKNPNLSADICSQFLAFTDSDCVKKGSQLKYNPAIKTDIDRAALIQGLLDDDIDHICSGHIPVPAADKKGSYFEVPAGLPQAQFALPAVLEHYQDQILSLEMIVQKTSHAITDCFNISHRGYIREGFWADLVLIDVEGSFIARDEDVISAAAWTIYNGNEFRSSVHTTIVNGQIVWANGALVEAEPAGMLMDFNRD